MTTNEWMQKTTLNNLMDLWWGISPSASISWPTSALPLLQCLCRSRIIMHLHKCKVNKLSSRIIMHLHKCKVNKLSGIIHPKDIAWWNQWWNDILWMGGLDAFTLIMESYGPNFIEWECDEAHIVSTVWWVLGRYSVESSRCMFLPPCRDVGCMPRMLLGERAVFANNVKE